LKNNKRTHAKVEASPLQRDLTKINYKEGMMAKIFPVIYWILILLKPINRFTQSILSSYSSFLQFLMTNTKCYPPPV
jgi:hypothetical protein